MDRYAVFGLPVKHSKSPIIHSLFAEQTGQALVYSAEEVPPEQFDTRAMAFFQSGGRGLNCTVPLKELAFRFVAERSERAQLAGAVNTIAVGSSGALFGDNTDGVGLLRDLTTNLQVPLSGKHILIVGAGGAVRGILEPLMRRQPARLVIANRTRVKAEQLAHEFSTLGDILATSLDLFPDLRFDVVINGTAASLSNALPKLPSGLLAPGATCYDLAYAKEPTPFVRWAEQQGAALAIDGLGMLVEQAAEAFFLWRGARPDTRPVIETLRHG